MARNAFTFGSFLIRLAFAVLLVFLSYNPSGYSFYHWGVAFLQNRATQSSTVLPMLFFCGVVLVIGWVVYVRATLRSLGTLGLILAAAFFGSIVWLIAAYGIIPLDNTAVIGYIILLVMSAILAVGMSWSHIRQRLSGQADVDEIEDDDR